MQWMLLLSFSFAWSVPYKRPGSLRHDVHTLSCAPGAAWFFHERFLRSAKKRRLHFVQRRISCFDVCAHWGEGGVHTMIHWIVRRIKPGYDTLTFLALCASLSDALPFCLLQTSLFRALNNFLLSGHEAGVQEEVGEAVRVSSWVLLFLFSFCWPGKLKKVDQPRFKEKTE